MKRVRARVKNKQILFTSERAAHMFFEMAEGKDLNITIDDAPTANMRRYFEGAVVPCVFYQFPHSGWASFKDAREALKFEFLVAYTKSLAGKRVKVAKSTTDLSKEGFRRFLDEVIHWLMENGLEFPDPEDYKAWRDSAPPAWEIYPPVLRLKMRYDEERGKPATTKSRTRPRPKPNHPNAPAKPKRKSKGAHAPKGS